MQRKVNVFLPMRSGSERIKNKNTRRFAGESGGLCKIKIKQLLKCRCVDKIFVSTDDPKVIAICNKFRSTRIHIEVRPNKLATSSTLTDDLIKYVPSIMPEGHILWTHVTSPFITSSIYDHLISVYFKKLPQFDSLMTVTKLQKFIWNNDAPIGYNRALEKWPRTQTITPLFEVNSGAFLASKECYLKNQDRIGNSPYFYELEPDVAFDIDWWPEFKMAEYMLTAQATCAQNIAIRHEYNEIDHLEFEKNEMLI